MKLINNNIELSYQKNSIKLHNGNESDVKNYNLLKNFLFHRKLLSFKDVFSLLSLMLKDTFKKNLSINFQFNYLYFEYNDQYYIKKILLEEKINIFQLNNFKEYCILMVPYSFISICTHVLFGDNVLTIYKKNIYHYNKSNHNYIMNIIFDNIFITINTFLKKFFCCSVKCIFTNKFSIKNFFKNNNLDGYLFFLFQVTYKGVKDLIKICIPKIILYQISLQSHNYLNKTIKKIWNKKIEHNIRYTPVSLKVNVISYTISLNYFLNLKIGDIFHIKIINYVFGFINGKLLILGKYGIYDGYRSLCFKCFIPKENKYMENKDSIMTTKENESNLDNIINQDQKSNKLNEKKILNQETVLVNKSNINNCFLNFTKKMKPFMDIPIAITIELGTKKLSLKKLLKLSEGSILKLNQTDNVPLKIFINNYFLALGELVIINETYGVRITKLLRDVTI